MLHPLALIVIVLVVVYDSFGAVDTPDPSVAWALTLGGFLLIAAITHMVVSRAGVRLDRTGSWRTLRLADRAVSVSRWLTGIWFIASVFGFDFIGAARGAVGDLVGVDELIAVAPPLLVYAAGWWSFYPIDRRLHDATMLRLIDLGRTVHPMPTRMVYAWEKLRDTVIAGSTPLVLILLWSEAMWQLANTFELSPWPNNDERTALALAGAQLAGAVVVLALTPAILLRIWDTAPLVDGPLRDRLTAMCRRHRVRCGGMRVWNTRGLILNAAVVGFLARLRYVLLTDALIENLPAEQLEAVMAHEIGHVRRRHLPWLLATLIATLGLSTWLLSLLIAWAPSYDDGANSWLGPVADVIGLVLVGALGIAAFGYVSRLFERQADAFAVLDACGTTRRNGTGALIVRAEEAEWMSRALNTVADLNHIPKEKFTWRHGSIADRQRRLAALVGRRLDELPIDRAARLVRLAVALALIALLIATVMDDGQDARPANAGLASETTAAPAATDQASAPNALRASFRIR